MLNIPTQLTEVEFRITAIDGEGMAVEDFFGETIIEDLSDQVLTLARKHKTCVRVTLEIALPVK